MIETASRTKTINLNPVAAVAVVVLGALVAWLLLQRGNASDAASPEAAVLADTAPASTPGPVNAGFPPLESRLSPVQEREYQQSKLSTFESRYRQDTSDAAWSAPTEKKMMDAATEPALNEFGTPTSYDADCQAHLCKVTMSFATLGQAQDWEQFYVIGLGGAVARVSTTTQMGPDGKASLIIYGTRNGSESLLNFTPTHNDSTGPTSH